MKILFIHPNFPGQFVHLAKTLAADPKNKVVFACHHTTKKLANMTLAMYNPPKPSHGNTHPFIEEFDHNIRCGQSMWRVCQKLQKNGFTPDIIIAHPGWGDALFVKDIFPDSIFVSYCEYYYRAFGQDLDYNPNQPVKDEDICRTRLLNAINLFTLEACDWAMTPTLWQYNMQPKEFQHKFSVIHDGIDTKRIAPTTPTKKIKLPDGSFISPNDEIITYVSRGLEECRGFSTFMHYAEQIQKERPNCHILVIGSGASTYWRNLGNETNQFKTYLEEQRKEFLSELNLDESRLHWMGQVRYDQFINLLHYSNVHIYLTIPFVLSWSMLEAMAAGCLVIGSNTPPVVEVIEEGKNGLLVDFFSPEELTKRTIDVLTHKDQMQSIRKAARDTITSNYTLSDSLLQQQQLIKTLHAGKIPTSNVSN